MKKSIWVLPIAVISGFAFWTLNNFKSSNKVETEDIPGNPGYYQQLYEIKKNPQGYIDWDLYKQTSAEIRSLRTVRATGILSNITELGPDNVGGRTRALIADYADPNRLFAGGVSGGLWVSTNRGASWSSVDDDMANLSITSITQNPFDHNVFYFCGGEGAGNSAGIPGEGIYKSTDGGVTFNQLPASTIGAFDYCWSIVHSLTDTNTFYVGTASNGLWRSSDAGTTFQNVRIGGEACDIETFSDGSVMVGFENSGIYSSPTGDSATFTEIISTLPVSGFRRIQLTKCRTNEDYVYAIYAHNNNSEIHSFWQSTDQGASWTQQASPTDQSISMPFPWYSILLFVDDFVPNRVFVGGIDIAISHDGGANWSEGEYSHADHHVMIQDPTDADLYYVGNDGGVWRYDINVFATGTWSLNNGYNVTQFYTGCFFPTNLDYWGGTQDNGTQSGNGSSQNTDHIYGGDGAFCAVNQQSPFEGYVSWQRGHLYKTVNAAAQFPTFNEAMGAMDADFDGDIDDNTWFINPFEMNLMDGQQMYFPTRARVWKTIDGTANWEQMTSLISDIYSVGISYESDPVIYLGGSSKFYRVPSGIFSGPGDEVNLISSIPGPATGNTITCLTVDPQDNTTVYASLGSIVSTPRIYKITDANTATPTWTSIHGDLPTGLGVNWIEVSPYNGDYLMAATDFGLFSSSNGGTNWILETDVPNVSVHQIRLRYSDMKLFIYTHGRGVFVADVDNNGMSIENESEETVANIYPTVTSGNVNIQTTLFNYRVDVHDVAGRRISSGFNLQQLNLGSEANGIYLVSIIENNKLVHSQKVFLSK